MDAERAAALRSLPSVDAIVASEPVQRAGARVDPARIISIARRAQDDARRAIAAGALVSAAEVIESTARRLERLVAPPSPEVINGTGVIIQTNLGRAPVSRVAADAMVRAATTYSNLEVELESGQRGGRGDQVVDLLRCLTGAEDALVVNNNASAVLLALTATCAGREVIVSRGEAVEIGGGFRIPDVLRQSGATLVEVGTTNRTYARDYAKEVTDRTAAILRVHASNFAILGFTARPNLEELVAVAEQHNLLMIEDVGSGCLLDTGAFGLAHEPTLAESVAAGVDLVCASGDKLLGGPQAGVVLGRHEAVERLRRHPLARALRADKTCLAGLAATLQHYLRGDAIEQVPVWWMISRAADWLAERAAGWRERLPATGVRVVTSESVVGGGSLPGRTLPSSALSIAHPRLSADRFARRLRMGSPSVFPRIDGDQVIIDARTVLHGQDDQLIEALRAALEM